jgi:hypothetical protein
MLWSYRNEHRLLRSVPWHSWSMCGIELALWPTYSLRFRNLLGHGIHDQFYVGVLYVGTFGVQNLVYRGAGALWIERRRDINANAFLEILRQGRRTRGRDVRNGVAPPYSHSAVHLVVADMFVIACIRERVENVWRCLKKIVVPVDLVRT